MSLSRLLLVGVALILILIGLALILGAVGLSAFGVTIAAAWWIRLIVGALILAFGVALLNGGVIVL